MSSLIRTMSQFTWANASLSRRQQSCQLCSRTHPQHRHSFSSYLWHVYASYKLYSYGCEYINDNTLMFAKFICFLFLSLYPPSFVYVLVFVSSFLTGYGSCCWSLQVCRGDELPKEVVCHFTWPRTSKPNNMSYNSTIKYMYVNVQLCMYIYTLLSVHIVVCFLSTFPPLLSSISSPPPPPGSQSRDADAASNGPRSLGLLPELPPCPQLDAQYGAPHWADWCRQS